jgi:hypothetical protein
MGTNVVFIGWDRPTPGRERLAAAVFQEFQQYLGGLQQAGAIQSFESVFLTYHGGDLNGFTLIRGEFGKLDALLSSEEWETIITRAGVLMDGFGVLRGVTGELLMKRMESFLKAQPA